MANVHPVLPPSPYPCCSSPNEQSFQVLSFAVALIVALAAIITGVLGIYKIDFFAGIGTHVSKGLAIGGGALAGTAIITFITCVCVCRRPPAIITNESTQQDQAPVQNKEPKAPQPSPPRKKYAIKKISDNPDNLEQPLPAPHKEGISRSCKPVTAPTLTWQPLINLQEKRNQTNIYVPPTQSLLLVKMRKLPTACPIPTKIEGDPRIEGDVRLAHNFFVHSMKKAYRGLVVQGKFTVISQQTKFDLIETNGTPINIFIEAEKFIRERVEAFNSLLAEKAPSFPPVDINTILQSVSENEKIYTLKVCIGSHKTRFVNNLTQALNNFFQTEADIRSAMGHFAEIKNFIIHEVDTFNTNTIQFLQDPTYSNLGFFEEVDSQPFQQTLGSIETLSNLWSRMEGICSFEGAIDVKIDALESLCTDLPEPNSALWIDFPIFKTLIVISFNSLSLGFFANYTFWLNDPQDMQRKDRLQTIIDAIAHNLGVDPLKIEIDTKEICQNDALLAAALENEERDRRRAMEDQGSMQTIQQLLATGQYS